MSDEPFHDLAEAYKRTANCCEYVQVLASRKPVPTTTLVRPRRPEAYLFQVTVNTLEKAIPPAVKAVEHVADELAEARREMTHGSLAEMCGLSAASYHQLAVDLAREVLARLKRAAEDRGAKFHGIAPTEGGDMAVYHVGFDCEVMMEVELDRMYAAVGVGLCDVERLTELVQEEYRIAFLRNNRAEPEATGWDAATEARNARPCAVSVDVLAGKIRVDDQDYDAPPHHCRMIKALLDAEGDYVTGPEMEDLPNCRGEKFSREFDNLVRRIPAIETYLRRRDTRGYRLVLRKVVPGCP